MPKYIISNLVNIISGLTSNESEAVMYFSRRMYLKQGNYKKNIPTDHLLLSYKPVNYLVIYLSQYE